MIKTVFQKIIREATLHPRTLFLVDSLGAALTAFILGIVLIKFEYIFGMPKNALYFLSAIACVFAVYSFFCFLIIKENWQLFLKIIAFANLLYCIISLSFVIYFFQKLTVLGFLYFLVEIGIIIFIAILELKTLSQPK